MRIKIELNLEVEVFLRAKIRGDMILTLLYVCLLLLFCHSVTLFFISLLLLLLLLHGEISC